MKIYCILFDTCNHDKELFSYFEKNEIQFNTMITNSFTTTSLVSTFSGLLPSEISKNGVGWDSCYVSKNQEEKDIWNSKIIFNKIPDSWELKIYGDKDNYKFITNNCCKIDIKYEENIYTPYHDEIEILNSLQEEKRENIIYFIKFNHYHNSQSIGSINRLTKILDSIDFKEKNSFFWVFSDHGRWNDIDNFMKPPHSSIGWNIVVNNINDHKDNRQVKHITDLYHYIMMFANNEKPKFSKNYYYCEDGRAKIDPKSTTTFTVVKQINNSLLTQMSYHNNYVKVYYYDLQRKTILKEFKMSFADITNPKIISLKEKLLETYGDRIKNG